MQDQFNITVGGPITIDLIIQDNSRLTSVWSKIIVLRYPPIAIYSFYSTVNPMNPLQLIYHFNATKSFAHAGEIVRTLWHFADNDTNSSSSQFDLNTTKFLVSHHFTTPGIYRALLQVFDDHGRQDTFAQNILVTSNLNQTNISSVVESTNVSLSYIIASTLPSKLYRVVWMVIS